ncbi:reverse transcriptase [Senna tora]|uniref:Reverse transcriptase n=1 Tax=Senna tora TaxID=362788 RepID=A0A834TFY9_9FABA|nr:reverse transcriptase [Senna tora]
MIFERIDRFLANSEWIHCFPEALNYHLPRIKSDHLPMLLVSKPSNNLNLTRPFRCERVRLQEPSFINLASNYWKEARSASHGLGVIREKAPEWNKLHFGNIFQRKRESVGGWKEEEMWASKARMDWLSLGDSNTAFFHASVVMRRRTNKISALKDNFPENIDFPMINDRAIPELEKIPSNEEIRIALWSLKPFKAAGIDGFQPGFFQKCWEFVGDKIWLSNCIHPSRGIRQGDPMSPYIFIICMEVLSRLIFAQVRNRNWTPVKIRGSQISHLLCAEDVLIYAHTDRKSVLAIQSVLNSFLQSSGLSANIDKSSVWFSPNTPTKDRNFVTNTLQFSEHPKPGKYLGFPLGLSRRVSDYKHIVDKVLDKVENWKAKYLSKAGLLKRDEDALLVNEVAGGMGDWKWDSLSFEIPAHIKRKINSIACLKHSQEKDVEVWKLYASGTFNLNSAFSLACNNTISQNIISDPNKDLRWVWRIPCYPKIRFFIWQLVLNALPCRAVICSRGIQLNTVCPLCNSGLETVDHIFCNCSASRKVWEVMGLHPTILLNVNQVLVWTKSNAENKSKLRMGVNFGSFFVFGLWEIWLARNSVVFENNVFDPVFTGGKAIFKSVEYSHLYFDNSEIISKGHISVGWKLPPLGWWKLNIDGSCQGSSNQIGGGGLLRDPNGNWVHGFMKIFGEGNSLMAELWAIVEGLQLAKLLNCSNIIVESDSMAAVNFINSNSCGNLHHLSTLISLCRATLSGFYQVKVVHIHREGNACVDILAKQAVHSQSQLLYFDKLPAWLSSSFLVDLVGVEFDRIVNSVEV